MGSTEILLRTSSLVGGNFEADVKTAGACMLLAQAAMPCAILAADTPRDPVGSKRAASSQDAAHNGTVSSLTLRGGTDAAMAPPFGYTSNVLLPTLRQQLGVSLIAECLTRGFFPQARLSGTLDFACIELATLCLSGTLDFACNELATLCCSNNWLNMAHRANR